MDENMEEKKRYVGYAKQIISNYTLSSSKITQGNFRREMSAKG